MGTNGYLRIAGLALAILICLLAASNCGGRVGKSLDMQSLGGSRPAEVSLDGALGEINALQAPDGVDAALFQQLKDELARQLTAKGVSKFASKPPSGEANAVSGLAFAPDGAGWVLAWHYRSVGDYNQDGTANIADITPLAVNFLQPAPDPNSIQGVVDGNGDGVVNIADVTPLAMNFLTDCAGYRVQGADDFAGPWTTDAEITIAEAEANGRLLFRVPYSALAFAFYRVIPVDGAGAEGIASNIASTRPAIASVSPGEGVAGTDVAFSAVVAGVLPISYAWDFGGGAAPNTSAEEAPTVTLGVLGSYSASLTVASAYGSDTYLFTLTVIPREWVHTWGGGDREEAYALGVDGAMNAYVAGTTYSFGAGNGDAFLIKYGASSALLWEKAWGGGDYEYAQALGVDGAGNAYVAGYTDSFGAGSYDAFLLKYDAGGALLWEKTWGGAGNDWAYALGVDGAGNAYVAGYTNSFGAGYCNAFLLKYDASGALLWEKTWDEGAYDEAYALCVDGGGNVYVAGAIDSVGNGSYDAFLLKYDASGALLWEKTWGGASNDRAQALGVDGAGNAYVAGYTDSFGAGSYDAFLLKYDAGGALLWEKTWGGASNDRAQALGVDGAGNAYVAGTTYSFGAGSFDAFLLKYGDDGALLWVKTWGGGGFDSAYALGVDGAGMIYLGGSAPNIYGSWSGASGVDAAPGGTENSPVGSENFPSGTQGTPGGTETEPDGVEDTGAGGADALVMKIDPSLW